MAAFTVQRTGNWSNATSTGPWFVTGTGLPSGGHGTAGVPGAGDSVTIGSAFTVTVDSNQAVGTANNNVNQRDLAISGTLTIANNVTLTVTSSASLSGGTLNLGPGSVYSVDGTVNSISYYSPQFLAASGKINAIGVSGNPCQFASVGTTSATASQLNGIAFSAQTVVYTYCNFTNFIVNPLLGASSSIVLTNCKFINAASTPVTSGANITASGTVKFIQCSFSGTAGSACMLIRVASGLSGVTDNTRIIDGCTFDLPIQFATGCDGWRITRSIFPGPSAPINSSSSGAWASVDHCVFKWTSALATIVANGPITNCIFVTDSVAGADQQGVTISNQYGPSVTTNGTVSSGNTLTVLGIPCDLPAGTTLNFGGVALTLTAAAVVGATSLTVTTISGSITSASQCYVHIYMGNIYQANTSNNNNAPFYCSTTFAPTVDTAITVKNNIMLPSINASTPGQSGQVFNSTSLNAKSHVTIEHNTCVVGNNAGYGAVSFGDLSGSITGQAVNSIQANIAYCTVTPSTTAAFVRCKSGMANPSTVNFFNPANFGFNGTYNVTATGTGFDSLGGSTLSTTTAGYLWDASGSAWLAATIGISAATNDLKNVNPNFVDPTRDIATAYVAVLGQTGSGTPVTDWKATLAYLAGSSGLVATPTFTASIINYIFSGYSPQSSSYDITYPGDLGVSWIGAVNGAVPTLPPNLIIQPAIRSPYLTYTY